ncbi:MAG: hypothetical protein J3R72DRAFT_520129, partial [Linnemannia gamsii]
LHPLSLSLPGILLASLFTRHPFLCCIFTYLFSFLFACVHHIHFHTHAHTKRSSTLFLTPTASSCQHTLLVNKLLSHTTINSQQLQPIRSLHHTPSSLKVHQRTTHNNIQQHTATPEYFLLLLLLLLHSTLHSFIHPFSSAPSIRLLPSRHHLPCFLFSLSISLS